MAKSCIEVDPPFVEFKDVQLGKVYSTVVTAINVGRITREIFFESPKLKAFKFSAPRFAKNVAPGLSVSGLLEFIPEKEEKVTDYIYVHVDAAEKLEVPLQISPRVCSLSMDSKLDFGFLPASGQIITRFIPITNRGTASGVFKVLHCGDSLIRLSPCSGVVAAGATRRLKVELHADKPRKVDEKALIRLQNGSIVVLNIRADVVEQHLEILDTQGNHLSCLCFGPVYYGTSRVERVVFTNNGPQACDWVCLPHDSAAGTESGANLDKSTDFALVAKMQRGNPAPRCPCPVVECIPNQGRLGAYKKTTVTVRFSPIFHRLDVKSQCQPSRQDYCLFLHLDSVRSKHGFMHRNGNSTVELAVTGTGLPVVLLPRPSNRFDFSTCEGGQRGEHLCVLQNFCPHLPIHFRFRKLAHFGAQPSSGTIAPGRCQDITLYFNARQQGEFHMCQKLDVLGYVAPKRANSTTDDEAKLRLGSFYTISLHLSAICKIEMTPPSPKLNPGITPIISNPTGLRPNVRSKEIACCYKMVRAAIVSARKTTFHMHHRKNDQSPNGEEFLALPNDRATSIRPASPHTQFRTIFTGVQRYTYLDPDYSLTWEETEKRQLHRQRYTNFLKQLRQSRLQKIKTKLEEQGDKFGIISAQGLKPPKLLYHDVEVNQRSGSQLNYVSCGQRKDRNTSTKQVSVDSHTFPATSQEITDCERTLTPQELYQVIIGPVFVDFGEVCFQSVCDQKVDLINPLPVFVRVQFEVDCSELEGSCPLSHVLQPFSHSAVTLTFQSNKLGHFYRPISYTINQQHPGQILVKAMVVRNYLELSTSLLILGPNANLLASSGYRTSVTLRNPRNQPAEFTWRPVVPECGILFSIRPASGTVEPYSELDCEVVWHAAFSSPQEGDFDLCVIDGNTKRLHCIAKVGAPCIRLAENRLMFESVPLNMPSIRVIILHNIGQNHAYYRVLDVCPLPCMVVTPCEGVVPSRGKAVIAINFNPDSVIKFDTRVAIAVKNMKPIEVRVGGSVEPPNVDISMPLFHFYGVHIGSERAVPFTVINHSTAAARLTFDLSQYPDFSLRLSQPAANNQQVVRVVEAQGHQKVNCSLVFSPTETGEYDFKLVLMVNGMRWPIASPLPFSSSTSPFFSSSSKCITKVIPWTITMAMKQPHIQATVLCAPVEMFPSSLQFHMEAFTQPSQCYTKTVELKAACEESVCWHNIRDKSVHWCFERSDTKLPEGRREDKLHLLVTPSSGCLGPGQSICLAISITPEAFATYKETSISLSLFLGNKQGSKMGQPYKKLPITVIHHLPNIAFNPPQLFLTPVPLESSITAKLTLVASGYASGTSLSAEVDEVDLEDGTKAQPICVTFPEGNTIPAQDQTARVTSLICRVSFFSVATLSICTNITFTDHLNNRFKVKLCATSDNCLLTVWPQMASQRSMQQIVLKNGATVFETITYTPSLASDPTSSSSLFEPISATPKNSSSESFSQSESGSQTSSMSIHQTDTPQTDICVPLFPSATSSEGQYYQDVLIALEKWFSFFGWLNGPNPTKVPQTLRRILSEDIVNIPKGQAQGVSQKKDPRSAVEMIHHLAGRRIPNISHCQTFSTDIHKRTLQLLQQNEAIFAFLRAHGACLSHIRAEYLLDKQEFNHWCSLQSDKEQPGVDYNNVDYESLSKRCWTDFLLQLYKVFVLCRVSEISPNLNQEQYQEDKDGILNIHSLPSNFYSCHELKLLSWLNSHYHYMRNTVWGPGSIPPVRWIINFDLDLADGLVLATLLAAYCPYLVSSHFQRMYTTTHTLEQILHNNIIIIQALTMLSLNMDLKPTDLSDPNPVQMLMLCVLLYERLPQYQPINTISLSGGLNKTLSKQVYLKNPSNCLVKYRTLLLGQDAKLFSVADGSTVTISPNGSTDLTIQYCSSFLQPKEAVLLLISTSTSARHGATLTFKVNTCISQIIPTKSVRCKTPCYVLKVVQVPITNTYNVEADFSVMLVESTVNPMESEKEIDRLVQQALLKAKNEKKISERSCHEEMAEGDGTEFISTAGSVNLKPGQSDTLILHFLPFSPGVKYCAVLLICPQVGDMVYIVKATADLPQPSPLRVRHSSNIFAIPGTSVGPGSCISALRLRCTVGQTCEELIRLPLINSSWENSLALWAQHRMSAMELQRRMMTYTLHSSSVRASMAACMLSKKQSQMKDVDYKNGVIYSVEVSLPRYFTVPSTVTMPIRKETNIWKNPSDHDCVEIPLRFKADCVGQFSCQMVLKSCFDTRVYLMEALVTTPGGSHHLDFSSPAQHSVTQDIPLHNETNHDWTFKAELCAEGFYGPNVLIVPAGTRACYPLTFHPSRQGIVMGKLSLHNSYNGVDHVFTIRGVGERPLPVEHVVLRCPVGKTTHRQLSVPNYSQNPLSLQVVTDLSFISGNSSLKVKPGQSTLYTLAVLPQKRGVLSGCISFIEIDHTDERDADRGNMVRLYEVFYTLEIHCEPETPVNTIKVLCPVQSSVAIEIPVSNPGGELLILIVDVEGDDLCGADWILIPPLETLNYKVTFSPGKLGKSRGSVVFHSETIGEFWYQLDLYAIPSAVVTLPQACCPLGKSTRQSITVVNPTAETVEVIVSNSNPKNYMLELDSESTLTVEPHSDIQLGVLFTPSSIGECNQGAKITFTSTQLQQWCVLLFGRGLMPGREEPLSICTSVGTSKSLTILFTNPTECPATLTITLTDKDPSTAPDFVPVAPDKDVFSLSLSQAEGIQISEGGSLDVPVVFTPKSMDQQQAWLCISLKPLNTSASGKRARKKLSTISWIYPLHGIPVSVPADISQLCVLQCEAGCQLEKKLDVHLTGYRPGAQSEHKVFNVNGEDFQCEVCFESETEDCLSACIQEARHDPETSIVTLTINLTHSPVKQCRSTAILVVHHVSGQMWEFSLDVIATEPQVDDFIETDVTEFGKTSALGFYLTSTTRRPEPFTATFQPGSSDEFAVAPCSGMLPPVDSSGTLINVFFTPAIKNKRHNARLIIQASAMRWMYDVRGITSPLSVSCPKNTTPVLRTNYVAKNLRVPALANSSPLKVRK
ncbi:cilia- and flagella-associated protein 47-like isoform X2 [Corythoichthys intestinalis]|uniref:cilia- and flagella-associated protein 47-like isoform X2 n=1 Tax=Corythoichthys intestinalis TaxID=161448 RepID=UPI0025A60D2C|nr:cilia- and flagella-associated protein 47-like isoform X2 [Corythoichthys intestinalis]